MIMASDKLIVYEVLKEDLLAMRFDKIENLLKTLKKSGKSANSSLMIIFSGYDDVPDEVYEIPAIRNWTGELIKRNPEIFYYLNRDLQGDQIFLSTLCDVESFHVGEATRSPDEYFKLGINPMNLPKKQLRLKLPDGLRDKISKAVRQHGESVGDRIGAEKSLSIFKIFD